MLAQILAITIFLVMFILVIIDKWERYIITLICAAITLISVFGIGLHSLQAIIDTLNIKSIFENSIQGKLNLKGIFGIIVNLIVNIKSRKNKDEQLTIDGVDSVVLAGGECEEQKSGDAETTEDKS